jgi:hypothetical protein
MERKRPGRRTARAAQAERVPISFRVTPAFKAELDYAAMQSGRSLAQEIEFRLERSLAAQHWLREALEIAFERKTAALMLAIGCVVQSAAQTAMILEPARSELWLSNAFAFKQVADSVNRLLQLIKPDGDASQLPTPEYARLLGGHTKAKDTLEGLASLSAKSVAEEITGLNRPDGLSADAILIELLWPWSPIIRDWLGEAMVAHLRDRLRNTSPNPDPSPNSALEDSSVSDRIKDKPGGARRKRSKPKPPK